MAKPVCSFVVRLGLGFWIRIHLWERADDAPVGYKFPIEGCFEWTRKLPKKVGDMHLGRDYLSLETITHEAYHAVAELRRRVNGTPTYRGKRWNTDDREEWRAAQIERLVGRVVSGLRQRGESAR